MYICKYVYMHVYTHIHTHTHKNTGTRQTTLHQRRWTYGVALVSRLDKIIGLFCKRGLQKSQYSAKDTYSFIDPTDRSHPIDCLIAF